MQRKIDRKRFVRYKEGSELYSMCQSKFEQMAKKAEILRDRCDGIKTEARYVTINDVFEMWVQLKRGLKDNTFQNYRYMYEQFVKPNFGKTRVSQLKKTDVRRFYNTLADERELKISMIDNVHTALHQVLDMAVDDDTCAIIRLIMH